MNKPFRIKDPKLIKSLKGKPCQSCGFPGEVHHIKSVGAGGDDVMNNILILCRREHTEIHTVGITKFCKNKIHVREILEKKWWTIGPKKLIKK